MRITTAHIENLTDWVNVEKGYPREAYRHVARESGVNYEAQPNHIRAYRSSGHWMVVQQCAGGGERDLRIGTAREVYEFLLGMQEAIMLDQMTARYEVKA